jgi:hypothetical protein
VEFTTRQRISQLKETVVPANDIDDPLIVDPPRLIDFDWEHGGLTLVLSRPVNETWIWALHNMGGHTAVVGKGPESFSIGGNKAMIDAEEASVQRIIDYFKQWLPQTNRVYEERIRQDLRRQEEQQRRELKRQIEEQEARARVLKNIRL